MRVVEAAYPIHRKPFTILNASFAVLICILALGTGLLVIDASSSSVASVVSATSTGTTTASANFVHTHVETGQTVQVQDDDSAIRAAMQIEEALVDAIARAERSVVAIARVRKGTVGDPTDPRFVPNEFGSGVVIDADGLILTNYHVLGNTEENDYFVWIQRRPYRVTEVFAATQVSAADPWTDLAVLSIDATDLQPIDFGDGSNLRKGQLVVTLGNPYAIARDGEPSASWGMISNLNRRRATRPSENQPQEDSESLYDYGTLIQTDTRLEQGTSGGALLNLRGEMIGLTSSLAAMDRFESSAGFAIPVDQSFREAVEKLKRGEAIEYGLLGVSPRDLSAQQRRDGEQGITVAQVVEGTPAAIVGVKFGDRITHLNGERIADSMDFMRIVGQMTVGSPILISIERSRVGEDVPEYIQLSTLLSKKYVDSTLPVISTVVPRQWRGMTVDYATAIPNYSERCRFVDAEGCIAIVDVVRDSPAWRAGLRPRDFISYVGDRRVTNPNDFHLLVNQFEASEVEVLLTHTSNDEDRKKRVPVE